MPALLYITLCHLPRRRDTAVEKKKLLLIPLYRGPDPSQKQWGLVNKLAVNRVLGVLLLGPSRLGRGGLNGETHNGLSPFLLVTAVPGQSHQHGWV